MKQVNIDTGRAKLFALDLPKGIDWVKISGTNWLCARNGRGGWDPLIKLEGNYRVLGFCSKITEEQALDIIVELREDSDCGFVPDALSRLSWILADAGIYTSNKYNKPKLEDFSDTAFFGEYSELQLKWMTFEAQLWSNPLLLLVV